MGKPAAEIELGDSTVHLWTLSLPEFEWYFDTHEEAEAYQRTLRNRWPEVHTVIQRPARALPAPEGEAK